MCVCVFLRVSVCVWSWNLFLFELGNYQALRSPEGQQRQHHQLSQRGLDCWQGLPHSRLQRQGQGGAQEYKLEWHRLKANFNLNPRFESLLAPADWAIQYIMWYCSINTYFIQKLCDCLFLTILLLAYVKTFPMNIKSYLFIYLFFVFKYIKEPWVLTWLESAMNIKSCGVGLPCILFEFFSDESVQLSECEVFSRAWGQWHCHLLCPFFCHSHTHSHTHRYFQPFGRDLYSHPITIKNSYWQKSEV